MNRVIISIVIALAFISSPRAHAANGNLPTVIAEHALLCGSLMWAGSTANVDLSDIQIVMSAAKGKTLAVVPAVARTDLPKVCQHIVPAAKAPAANTRAYFAFVSQTIDDGGGNVVQMLNVPARSVVTLSCVYRGRDAACKPRANAIVYRVPYAHAAELYIPNSNNARAPETLTTFSLPITFAGPIAYVTDRKPETGTPSAADGFFQNDRTSTTMAGCNADASADGLAADDCYFSYGIIGTNGVDAQIPRSPNALSDFYTAIGKQYPGFTQVVIYVHGFNNSFKSALQDARELSNQLNMPLASAKPPTPVIIYSWPTKAADYIIPVSLIRYPDDETNNGWTDLHFREFLKAFLDVDKSANKPTVHLIAHSMGNRPMLDGLVALSETGAYANRIGEVISFEPDVDMQTYAEQTARLAHFVNGIILYGSTDDLALFGSQHLHHHCRAGQLDCGDAYFSPAVQVIDATELHHCDSEVHHSYWAISPTVLDEVAKFIAGDVNYSGLGLILDNRPLGWQSPKPFPHYELPSSAAKDCTE